MTDEPENFIEEDPLMNQDILVALVLMGLLGVVGIVGNCITLRAIVMYRNMRVDMYVIMGGLALADIVHLLIAVPSHIIDFIRAEEAISDPWCKASRYLMNFSAYISAYHLVVLSVLRGIMLTNRGHSSPTGRHALYCSVVVWVVGALATAPVIRVWESFRDLCYYTLDGDIEKEMWLTAAFSCFVPIGMVLLIYATTYYIGKRYFADSYSRHEKQMSRLVTTVLICFVVCEVPYNVTNLHLNTNYEMMPTLAVVNDYLLCLVLADKAIRPIIYSKLSTDLGECFDEVINCTYCHRYYSDGPKPNRKNNRGSALSQAPLTTDALCEEVV